MKHLFENHDLVTEHGSQPTGVTDDVRAAPGRTEGVDGTEVVQSPHPICSPMIDELDYPRPRKVLIRVSGE